MKELTKGTRVNDSAIGPTMALVRLLQLASPALPIQYALQPSSGRMAAPEETLMMSPRPRCSMPGSTARIA